MEYLLNKSPLRTSEGFKINDIKLNLEIPTNYDFDDYIIDGNVDIGLNKKGGQLNSKIGITYDSSYEVNITISEKKDKPVYLKYDFNNELLVSNINIRFEMNSRADIIFVFKSDNKCFNHLNINIDALDDSKGCINIINMINDGSNFIDINSNIDDASITYNVIDLGGSIRVSSIYNNLNKENSRCYLNNIYIGKNKDIIDLNYYMRHIGIKSKSNIRVEGVLDDEAIKHFKGTIDFVSGSSSSIGHEKENVLLLSDKCKSKSLPMLLCGEEDVDGSHGVSTGMIDQEKLYYLMSRGYSSVEATKLIIQGNFNNILKEIPDRNIVEDILLFIDKKV